MVLKGIAHPKTLSFDTPNLIWTFLFWVVVLSSLSNLYFSNSLISRRSVVSGEEECLLIHKKSESLCCEHAMASDCITLLSLELIIRS